MPIKLGLIVSYARDICYYTDSNTKTIAIGGPGFFTESYLQHKNNINFINITPLNFFEVPIVIDGKGESGGATKGYYEKVDKKQEINSFENILINVISGEEFEPQDFALIQASKVFIDLGGFKRKNKKIGITFFEHINDNTKLFVKISDYELQFLTEELISFIKYRHTLIVTSGSKDISIYQNGSIYIHTPKKIDGKLLNTIGAGDTFLASFAYNYLITNDIKITIKKAIDDVYQFLLLKK